MKNKKYKLTGDYEYKELPVTQKELDEARKEARALLKKTKGEAMTWRSCWVCNGAHAYFLEGKWGKWILQCFADCGRYYYNKIDITIYD